MGSAGVRSCVMINNSAFQSSFCGQYRHVDKHVYVVVLFSFSTEETNLINCILRSILLTFLMHSLEEAVNQEA